MVRRRGVGVWFGAGVARGEGAGGAGVRLGALGSRPIPSAAPTGHEQRPLSAPDQPPPNARHEPCLTLTPTLTLILILTLTPSPDPNPNLNTNPNPNRKGHSTTTKAG